MAGWQIEVEYQGEERELGSESGRVEVDETIPPIDVDAG
jgi:hypothetical protein